MVKKIPARHESSWNIQPCAGGGFIAGTFVHTENGLVPIEKIKVDDSVLSQSETTGERTYKRVVNTFHSEDQEIILVRICDSETLYELGVTSNQLFWVKTIEWTRADQLITGSALELRDGGHIGVFCATNVFRTITPQVGWADRAWTVEENDGSGSIVDFRNGFINVSTESAFNWDVFHDEITNKYHKAQTYNLDVEDFNTYYVSDIGVWVHS